MIRIKNTEVHGLETSLIRAGYPMKMGEPTNVDVYVLQEDFDRGRRLGKVDHGTGHDNFLKGIIVQFDLFYPLYFTKQLQRYHFIDFISSQSTMHSITKVESIAQLCDSDVSKEIIELLDKYIQEYNILLKKTDIDKEILYRAFKKIIANLPSGFQLWAGMTTNYLQLKTIYFQRKNHKLKEDWGYFCKWIESLPHFIDFVMKDNV